MSAAPTFGEALLRLAPDQIHIPTRLGLYFPDKAAALGKLMAIHGQRTPITVRASAKKVAEAGQPWTLVTGMHRLNGAMLEGLEVLALERIGGTAADALDEEASENLDRREQPPLERAIFIQATAQAARERLAAQHGTMSQQKLAIKARWDRVKAGELRVDDALQQETDDTADTMSTVYGWQESVAEAFGRDKRAIRRALHLYRMLVEPFPDLIQRLSDHPVVGNNAAQLKLIADIKSEAQRRAVIEQLLANTELSADDARVHAGVDSPAGPAPLPYQKHFDAITGGWSRLNITQQRQFIPNIAAMLTSDDLKRRLRDQLNQELGDA